MNISDMFMFFSVFYQFNFVGRLLGPRGNSLKRVEATTGCRVFIRGKGSIKDTEKVSLMKYLGQTLSQIKYRLALLKDY